MRRSKHTDYKFLETQIYEYKGDYYIIEECQQGQELLPQHGSEQGASDFCAISKKLSKTASNTEIGEQVLVALDNFDRQPHPFDQFDIQARNKIVSGWFGARGMGSLEKNCRVVQVVKNIKSNMINVIPFDNHNHNSWNGPMEEKSIELKSITSSSLGDAVQAAFRVATYHPERKDPI